jgi:hypothetical protein
MDNEKITEQEEKANNHEYNIIVNSRPKIVTSRELEYPEVLQLAFDPVPTGPDYLFTVVYRRGHGNKPEGTLVAGQSVRVKEGMIFDVTATNKS